MRMVNGKPFNEVMIALREKKAPTETLPTGKKYFKSSDFFSTFDDIVGPCNYEIEYSDYTYTRISTGQELFSVKCRITIIDDNGEPILYKESYGGYAVKYEKETKKEVNLQNSPDFVCTYAFKACAKKFGIFGINSTDSGALHTTRVEAVDKEIKKDIFINVFADSKFVNIGDKDGRPMYRLDAHEVVNEQQCCEKLSQIIFYPNQYNKCADRLNAEISALEKGQQRLLRLKVKPLDDKKYCFKDFVKAS